MLESGRIRLVSPSAVIITHFLLASGQTLEDCFHKDCPRNVGCVHQLIWFFFFKERVRSPVVHPRFRRFARVSPEKRLELKSLKGWTKAEVEGPPCC
jgi:hypothetical protein